MIWSESHRRNWLDWGALAVSRWKGGNDTIILTTSYYQHSRGYPLATFHNRDIARGISDHQCRENAHWESPGIGWESHHLSKKRLIHGRKWFFANRTAVGSLVGAESAVFCHLYHFLVNMDHTYCRGATLWPEDTFLTPGKQLQSIRTYVIVFNRYYDHQGRIGECECLKKTMPWVSTLATF